MKICHVTSAHNSSDTRIFEKECTSLAKLKDCNVFLVARGDSYEKNGVHIIGVGTPPDSRFLRFFSFSKCVVEKSLELDADIYHLHDPELLQFVNLYKKKNKIVVFDSHEDVAESILDKEYIPKFARTSISFLYKNFAKMQMAQCDALVSVTPHIVDKLKKINYNTYMITNYPLLKDDSIVTSNRTVNKIIFAGGISEPWSHEFIINAIQDLNVTYELYGIASTQYLESLKMIPGWTKTHYHGKVSFKQVQEALRECGIGVAILKECHNTGGRIGTLGNTKLFEYMSAGLPVVCSNFVLWKDIVEKNNCGICINPASQKEFCDAINFLLCNHERAFQMGINGKKLIEIEYNWRTQEKILYAMYKKLSLKLLKNDFKGVAG